MTTSPAGRRTESGSITTDERYGHEAKTSAAATFGLVFGLSALICVLSVVLVPVGIVLGIVGLVVSVVGMVMGKKPFVTGRKLAVGGLVLSGLALLLSGLLALGVTFFLNDSSAVDRLDQQVSDLRDQLPDDIDVPQP